MILDDLYEEAKRRAKKLIEEVDSTEDLVSVIGLLLVEKQVFKAKSELLKKLLEKNQKD